MNLMSNEFTQQVSDIVVYGKEEANRLQNDHIEPEHLLLGILRDGECKAAEILKPERYQERTGNTITGEVHSGELLTGHLIQRGSIKDFDIKQTRGTIDE